MRTSLVPLALVGLLGLTALPGTANAAHEQLEVTGLAQNGKLVTILAGTGERLAQTKKVSGIADGFDLVSIDYSPRINLAGTTTLYGVATSGTEGQIYEIDPDTAVATARGLAFPIAGDVSIDVNPVPNALRVVSSDGTNLRFPLATFAFNRDAPLTETGVVGAAYTNSDNDPATVTRLYYVDAPTDRTFDTDNPNGGVLLPVGPTGRDLGTDTGFDVYTEGPSNIALLSDRDADGTRLYTLRLADGGVNPASAVLVQGSPVLDIAVDPQQ